MSDKACVACGKPLSAHLPPHDDCPMYIADGALTYHQQLELIAELSGWRARAEKAEADIANLRAAARAALLAMDAATVFVSTKERIKRPEGEDWWFEQKEALRAALAQGEKL